MQTRGEEEPIIGHTTPAGGNVFRDLGFEPGEAANLLMRAHLMMDLEHIIKERRLKQKDAAKLFGVSQPRISDLLRGKMETFTIDSLVNMLGNAGYRVTTEVRPLPQQHGVATEAPAAAQA